VSSQQEQETPWLSVINDTKSNPRTFIRRYGIVLSVRKQPSFVFIYYSHVQRIIIRYKDPPEAAEVKLNSRQKDRLNLKTTEEEICL
jgi:hypothetical protein